MELTAEFDENSSIEINLLTLKKKLNKGLQYQYFDTPKSRVTSPTLIGLNSLIKERRTSDGETEFVPSDFIRSGKDDDGVAEKEADLDRVQILTPQDQQFYKKYFAIRLRMTRRRGVKPFLDFHYTTYYQENLAEMNHFVDELFEDYCRWFNKSPMHKAEVDSFLENKRMLNKAEESVGWEEEAKKLLKRTPKRDNNDEMTSLTAMDTAVFFSFLRQGEIIFKSTKYLTDNKLTIAISILTGYWGNLRKKISNKKPSKKTLEKIKSVLLKIINLIDSELAEKKGPR